MTPDRLQSAAPFIAAGLLVVALVLFLLSLRYFRKSRTDFYWRRRRSAGQRGWRLLVWSLTLTLSSGIMCLGIGVVGIVQMRSMTATAAAIIPTASPTNIRVTVITNTPTDIVTDAATATATSSPTLTKTLTSTATQSSAQMATQAATQASTSAATSPASTATTTTRTVTPIATQPATVAPTTSPTPNGPASTTIILRTATPTPTPTTPFTPTLTFTPSETLVPAIATTAVLVSSVTPSAKAILTITALDTQISADLGPVAPGTSFKSGFNRIYFFVKFDSMQNGVLWRRQLLRDGTVLEDTNYLWGMAQQGTAYFFFGQEDGFKAGKYEVRLYLGQASKPVTTALFTVN